MKTQLPNLPTSSWIAIPAIAALPILALIRRILKRPHRPTKLSFTDERVVVLGATSGIGRAIAHEYATRGASVCIVGRRATELEIVAEECRVLSEAAQNNIKSKKILALKADFTSPEEMDLVRTTLKREWSGVDTVIVAAGVSALRPIMGLAGLSLKEGIFTPAEASTADLQKTLNIATAATAGNFLGPLLAAVTFIPLLHLTSPSPSILLVSSVGSVIPAPTRALYGATKAAALILHQGLAIEHPNIAFSHFMPATVEGDFRASAVDGGEVTEADPNRVGLKRVDVARKCVEAVDRGERTVFMPRFMRLAQVLYWFWPAFIERKAATKYNFVASVN